MLESFLQFTQKGQTSTMPHLTQTIPIEVTKFPLKIIVELWELGNNQQQVQGL